MTGKAGSNVPLSLRRLRDKEAWDLCILGWTHKRIADKLLLERSTVTKILQRVSTKASQQLLKDSVAEKMRQVELLKFIVDECMQAWERSKQQAQKASKTVTEKGEERTTQSAEGQVGDVRYLAQAQSAMADIRKVLGLDYPLKLLGADMNQLTDEQINAIISGQDPFMVVLNELPKVIRPSKPEILTDEK
jgi:hypothetical protein